MLVSAFRLTNLLLSKEAHNPCMQVLSRRRAPQDPFPIDQIQSRSGFNVVEDIGCTVHHPLSFHCGRCFRAWQIHGKRKRDFKFFRYDFDDPSNKMPTGDIDLDEVHAKLGR